MRIVSFVTLAVGVAGGLPAQQGGAGGHSLTVPAGFTASVFADNLGGVRYLALGPDGIVYASRPNRGVVLRLPDVNHDGVADTAIVVASGLNQPFGLAFRGDTLYVAETNEVVRYAALGSGAKSVVVPDLPAGGGHWTRTIVFGPPPESRLYLAIGSSCNICDETDPRRAAIVQVDPRTGETRPFATGLRNSVGLAFHPTTGELWATNNDRDNLGDDLPPEHLNIIKASKFYGWPECYLPGKPNPEYPDAKCDNVEPPALLVQAHSAPLGLAFYTGTMFPADYRGDAFMTFHGSWNRSVPTGAKVVRVRVQGGRPVSSQDFITGWQLPDGSRWGRPVSLLVLPDGSLLVSDDAGGRIWRVTYGR